MPGAVGSLFKVQELDLSFNAIGPDAGPPTTWRMLVALRKLDLSRNRLAECPEQLGKLSESLTELNLSFNSLRAFPACEAVEAANRKIDEERAAADPSKRAASRYDMKNALRIGTAAEADGGKVRLWGSLTSLDLRHNELEGELPATLATHARGGLKMSVRVENALL